jgi:hypothetical protein
MAQTSRRSFFTRRCTFTPELPSRSPGNLSTRCDEQDRSFQLHRSIAAPRSTWQAISDSRRRVCLRSGPPRKCRHQVEASESLRLGRSVANPHVPSVCRERDGDTRRAAQKSCAHHSGPRSTCHRSPRRSSPREQRFQSSRLPSSAPQPEPSSTSRHQRHRRRPVHLRIYPLQRVDLRQIVVDDVRLRGVVDQVVLVVILGGVEAFQRLDLRDDG